MKFMLQNKIFGIVPTAVVAMVMGLLSACSNDFPVIPSETKEKTEINVSFRISASSESLTRADIPEEFGTEIENRIDPNDLIILLFDDNDGENRLLEILYKNGSSASNAVLSSLGYGDYILQVKLDPELYSSASIFSVVTMSNWEYLREANGDIPLEEGITTLASLFNYTYGLNQDNSGFSGEQETWTPDNDNLIPMFGLLHGSLSGYSTSLYNEANPMDLGSVNMLRALVKIEVIDNSESPYAVIQDINITKRNTRGYLTPSLVTGENTQQVTQSRVPSEMGVHNPAGYSETRIRFKKEGNRYFAYVPELELGEEKSLQFRDCIDVTITYKGITEVRKIYMAPYDKDGLPYVQRDGWNNEWKSLLRNHIYRFTINSISVDPNIYLTVDVQPYSCVNLNPDLGLERTEDGYIVVRDKDGNVVKYIRTDGSELTLSLTYKWPEIGEFTGVFDSWKRVLVGYFTDGRRIVFNYEGDQETDDKVISWEIYSSNKSAYGSFIMETFGFRPGYSDGEKDENNHTEIIIPAFTYSVFDQHGYLISQTSYQSREHFQQYRNNPGSAESPVVRVAFKGDRYGDKIISYYDQAGKIYCQIEIKDGKEKYIYEDFQE